MKKAATNNPYIRRGFISRLPMWFKALFVKFWFAGAVFYFIGWGLSINSRDGLDLTVALGLVNGLVTDIFANRILVHIETEKQPCRRFILSYSKRFYSLPVNLFFGITCAFLVSMTYSTANLIALELSGNPEGYIAYGAEPLMYGLLYLLYYMIFVLFKNTFIKIYQKAKQ